MPHKEYLRRIETLKKSKDILHPPSIETTISRYKVEECKSCLERIKKIRSSLGQRKK